jgi:hypothetical protein
MKVIKHDDHCCEAMRAEVETSLSGGDPWANPRALVLFDSDDGSYGLIERDRRAIRLIRFCPWCGADLTVRKQT